jgi:hypothetical protein
LSSQTLEARVRARAHLFQAILLLMALSISGCASRSSAYKERFSEAYLSTDFEKALVVGADKYSYVFDMPDTLSAVIKSPLRGGVSLKFPNDGAVAFMVKPDGSIFGSFYAILPDSYFQGRDNMEPLAESLGFTHGRLYSIRGRDDVVEDGAKIPRYVGWSDADVAKYTKVMGGVYFLPLTIRGRRFLNKDVTTLQDANNYKMDQRHLVVIVDEQTGSVDLLVPAAAVAGAGICIATFPACFVAALPLMGMKP